MEFQYPRHIVTQKVVVKSHNGDVLALRRSNTDPKAPLTWDIPGGVVEDGENLQEAIIREIVEETGLVVNDLHLLGVFSSTSVQHPYLIVIAYGTEVDDAPISLSYEHDMYEWISKEEFLKRETKKHIKEILSL